MEKETSETLQKEIEDLKREPKQVMAAGLFIDDSKHEYQGMYSRFAESFKFVASLS